MDLATEDRRVEDSYSDHHLNPLSASTSSSSLIEMTPYTPVSNSINAYQSDSHHHHHPPHAFYQEFDWQQSTVPSADPGYSFHGFTDRSELTPVQLYHTFSNVATSDIYPAQTTALWHTSPHLMEDSASVVGGISVQRFLPGMGLARTLASSSSTSSSCSSSNIGKPKRRRVQSQAQRKAANIRERRRMFHLNTAFDELRKRLPAFNYEKRLSRIETLRLAMTYIAFMKDVTMGEDPHKVKLRASIHSDGSSDISGADLESCPSDDASEDMDN